MINRKWKAEKLASVFQVRPSKNQAIKILAENDLVSFVPMEDLGIMSKHFIATKTRPLSEVTTSYTYFSEDDVLLAKITPCFENGKLGIARNLVNGVGFGSSEFIVLRSNGEIIPEYLFYFLSTERFREEGKSRMSGAVGHKRVQKEYIDNLLIPFPESINEQKRIVSILDKAFVAIDKSKANAEQNLKKSKVLFKSYLQNHTNNAKDHWKLVRIDSVCESIIDCVNKTAPKTDIPTPYKMIRTTNVKNGYINLDSVNYVTEEVYRTWTRRQVPEVGDVILTREAPLGQVGMLMSDEKVFLGQRLVSYRVNPKLIINTYLLYIFQSDFVQNQILKLASGSTVQHMRVPDSKALHIYLPPLDEQVCFVEKLDALRVDTLKLSQCYQAKLNCLQSLKKSILQKAFTGELTKEEVPA